MFISRRPNCQSMRHVSEIFIRKRKGTDGNVLEEAWVAVKKSNGKIIKKLRYSHYIKTRMREPVNVNSSMIRRVIEKSST